MNIIEAVKNGDLPRVKELCRDKSLEISQQDYEECLLWATVLRHKKIITFLLQTGVDVNVHDSQKYCDNNTALMYASMLRHKKIITLLLKFGANINARNTFGRTALKVAPIIKIKKILSKCIIFIPFLHKKCNFINENIIREIQYYI
jgi:ankyrin repeat protein